MSLSQVIHDNIKPNINGGPAKFGSCRRGTAYCTLYQLEELFGQCHGEGDFEKVTKEWYFQTPRGEVTIHDYWWNSPDIQSIGSEDWRATRWMIAYLRRNKIKAHRGIIKHG